MKINIMDARVVFRYSTKNEDGSGGTVGLLPLSINVADLPRALCEDVMNTIEFSLLEHLLGIDDEGKVQNEKR